jgi:hypothetical protein
LEIGDEHYPVPWPFTNVCALYPRLLLSKSIIITGWLANGVYIKLLCVSIATIASLTVTIILYNFTYLPPRFNLILNGSIFFFWALGFGFLTMAVAKQSLLAKECTRSVWGGEDEAKICTDYKALWAMSLLGTYVITSSTSSTRAQDM